MSSADPDSQRGPRIPSLRLWLIWMWNPDQQNVTDILVFTVWALDWGALWMLTQCSMFHWNQSLPSNNNTQGSDNWIGDCWRVSLHWPAVPNSTRAPRELIGVPSLSFVHWSLLLCVLSTPLTVPMSLEALHRVLWHPMSAEGALGMFASSCYDFYWAHQPAPSALPPPAHTRDSQA